MPKTEEKTKKGETETDLGSYERGRKNRTENYSSGLRSAREEQNKIQQGLGEGRSKEDFSEEEEEEEEETFQLNPKQKLQLLGILLSSFLFFSLLLFPYQKLARYFFSKLANQISLSTGELDLSFLGTSFIDDISFPLGAGKSIRARQLQIEIPLLSLMGSSVDGDTRLKELQYSSETMAFAANELLVSLDLEGYSKPPEQWEGSIYIDSKNFNLLQLNIPQLESLGVDLSQMKVESFGLRLGFEQGKLSFDGSQLRSNYFTLKLKGFAQLQEAMAASRLNAEICIFPSPELENINSELMGVYILAGGSAGGELCLKVRGKLSQPDFQNPAANNLSQDLPTSEKEASPPPPSPDKKEEPGKEEAQP